MTPEQAFQIVDQICASVALSRADHQQVEYALAVLQPALQPQQGPSDSVSTGNQVDVKE